MSDTKPRLVSLAKRIDVTRSLLSCIRLAFNRAKAEFWTQAQWLQWRTDHIYGHSLFARLDAHSQGEITGAFELCTLMITHDICEHRYCIDGAWIGRPVPHDLHARCETSNCHIVWKASAPDFKPFF